LALDPGSSIGHYQVLAKLGEGGMGEVYRARDTRLNRDVAIKVLPPHFAGDAERVTRFEREAQALAALNHSNIAQIYGTEAHALVMEFVPGEDLAARLRRGPVFLTDALEIAKQVALALEAAHQQGIVHRDLKPANIKRRDDGTVKVLDFGLAKALTQDSGLGTGDAENSPTMTSPATALGVILGTAAYMAPEQARGRPVDKRADIWAFGCVLFEMLTGKRAFTGDTVTDILAAVVTQEPDWTALPTDTPAAIRSVLRKCLQKDPKRRLHDIADARLDLDDDAAAGESTIDAPIAAGRRSNWLTLGLTAVAAVAIGVVAGVAWRASREQPPKEWAAERLEGPAIALWPRISPDGHLVAFNAMVDGQTQVAVMKPGGNSWTVLTRDRTRGSVFSSSWSADGSTIYYDRITDVGNGIFSVPALGGDERLVIEKAWGPQALADGSLLFLRLNPERIAQVHRFWPATGKLDALPVASLMGGWIFPAIRGIDATRAVVFGYPIANKPPVDALHVLDLSTNSVRPIAADLGKTVFGFAGDPSGSVLAVVYEGRVARVVRIPLDDSGSRATVLKLFEFPGIDVATNGDVYASLVTRDAEITLSDVRDGVVDRVVSVRSIVPHPVLALADGRILISAYGGANSHVLVGPPGRDPYRFVQTSEETSGPIAPLPGHRVALLIGNPAAREIAIVAAETGSVLKRFKAPADVASLAASADGRTLYVGAAGTISAMSIDGGVSTAVCPGDSMAVDPANGDLIVKRAEKERIRLFRCRASGGPPQEVIIRGDVRMAGTPLSPTGIRNGRLLLPVDSPDSWYWFAGAVDLATGAIERVKLNHFTDIQYVGWTADGKMLGTGASLASTLWKFEWK
jgi:predicted Ser/Thr protein kinase